MHRLPQLCLALLAGFLFGQFAPALRAADDAKGLKFELYKDNKDEFRWRLKAANNKVLATGGQGYKAKADCMKGIENMQKAGDANAKTKFEVYEDNMKAFRWRLIASNGQTIAGSSEGYTTKSDCQKALDLVKMAGKAPIDDQTKK